MLDVEWNRVKKLLSPYLEIGTRILYLKGIYLKTSKVNS